ncbi:MAG TPA: DNA internalization-related competence protein ComEC/Rec2 [Phycisphaerales bacterium]|nr:DNA internalization-related competence protein ComEC/Rec2 [Phycisphaerales bacterium]
MPGEPVVCFVMDDIRRKLELIDRQLTGPNFHERVISTCPLVFVATGLIAGILIQDASILSVSIWIILLVLTAAATVFVFVMPQFSPAGRYVTAYLALACFVCLGAIRLSSFHQPEPNNIRNFIADEPKLAAIRGAVVTEPYINKYPDWEFARFKPSDATSSFYLKVAEAETIAGWTRVRGTVRVQVGEPVLDLKASDRIQAYCRLDRFRPPTNPGQFDVAAYLARRNIFVGVYIESRDGIKILQSPPAGSLVKLKTRIRQAASSALVGDMPQEDTSRGLLEALLLGYRRDIDSDTYRAFRKTGLLHFISLSGMHLGILVGIIWWLCRIAGLMKPARAAVCAAAVAVFLLVVPLRAPTLRAAIICWVFCASIFFRRRSNPINTLSLAAIILLLIRPTQLFEAGWQLSFAAVLGLLLFTERLHFFLYEKISGLRWRKGGPKTTVVSYRISSRPGPYSLRLFSAGVAAWIGGAGILLYHFYTINPLVSIWTLLVFPLVSVILTLGFLKMILFFPLPTLSRLLGIPAAFLSDILVRIVKVIANFDISQILVGRVSLMPVVLYYCIILFTGYVYFRRPIIKKAICAFLMCSLIIYLGALKWQRTHRDDLVLTCLDVGHGQAILARLPGKANVLFDAGSLYANDIGTRIVSPYLDYIGIRKIDALIISHNDTDHINGIPEIVENCDVRSVYANDAFFDRTDVWGTAEFLNDSLAEKGLEIKRIENVLDLNGTANIEMLWLNEQIYSNQDLSDNDRSQVSLIEFAGTKILLCSDIEKFAQRELLRLRPDLKADVVIVPHHGSTSTLDVDFLEQLDADVLICSCGRRQYERMGRDTKSVMYVPAENKLLCTFEDGAIAVIVEKNGMIKTHVFMK